MKKLILSLSVLFLTIMGFTAKANQSIFLVREFQCVNFVTDCGKPAIACGFTVGQIAEDMVGWNNFWCNEDIP